MLFFHTDWLSLEPLFQFSHLYVTARIFLKAFYLLELILLQKSLSFESEISSSSSFCTSDVAAGKNGSPPILTVPILL